MRTIVFWILGALSLLGGLLVAIHPKPMRCAHGLILLLAANTGIIFLLSAPLLGTEMLLLTVSGALLLVLAFSRREIMKLGASGLVRIGATRLLALGAVVWLGLTLWRVVSGADPAQPVHVSEASASAGLGAWLAIFLISGVVATAWVIYRARKHEGQEGESS